MTRILALTALLLTACSPVLEPPEAFEPTPGPGLLDQLLQQERAEGVQYGALYLDIPEMGRTEFDAIYIEPSEAWCVYFDRFLAGDGISCEAWHQWDRLCRVARAEGLAAPADQGWDRFFSDPPWIIATYEDADRWLEDEPKLPVWRDFYLEVDQYESTLIPHPERLMVDIYDDARPSVLHRFEEDDDGLQVAFETDLRGLHYAWTGQDWEEADHDVIEGFAAVEWRDVPRCLPPQPID
jgi:hypothetical protein